VFHWDSGLFEVGARTAIVYLALLTGLRLMGKREIGQMTPFDLVVLLLISNAVQNAMVGPDNSVSGGLVAAAVLLVLNRGIAWLRWHVARLRPLLEGSPAVLIEDGVWRDANLRREGLTREEVEMGLREHGVERVEEVHRAVLELDGSISVVTATIPPQRHQRRRSKYVRHPGS
jgi:uncharacterized membrane protein YcaP (DUF421 family)